MATAEMSSFDLMRQPLSHAATINAPTAIELSRSWAYVAQFLVKRAFDYLATAVGLVLISPLMALIALAIRLESDGPIFFRQERLGKDGRRFRVWKFRTMVVNAEAKLKELEHLNESQGGVLFKIKRDPRITRIGGLLRRTSLDELPQLLNVLQGDMSLIGPRPLPLRDCEKMRQVDEEGLERRLEVLPGLTGLWQVSGRSDLSIGRMIELDTCYVEQWSLGLDLSILARTAAVVLAMKGSY